MECLVHFSDQSTPMTFHTFGELIAGLYPGRCAHNGRRFAASSWWIRGFLRRHSSDLECSAAVPVDHLHRITERDIAQLRTVFEEFNALVEKLALTDAQVHAFDETKVSATAEDACHARVIHRRGAKPYRRVGVKTQKASLVAFISANGHTLPSAMLHPQDKRVPREHAQAWDTTSHQPDTLHLAAGSTATMTAFLYDQAFLHWDDHLPIGLPQLVLQDGYGAHYNVTTLLRLANRTGHCDGEIVRRRSRGSSRRLITRHALVRFSVLGTA